MARTRLRGLEIGGIQLGIEVPETCSWQWPNDAHADYSCLPRDPEVHVGVRIGKLGSDDLAGEHYALGSWVFEVARRGEDWLLGLSRGGQREQLACFDKDFIAGEVVLSADAARRFAYPLRSPLDEWIVLHRTVANGGLCLNGTASAHQGHARVRLGLAESHATNRWTSPTMTLLGRNTLWIREDAGLLRVFRTPWGGAMDRQLGAESRVGEFSLIEETPQPYRELLDPHEAAELLVTHAVVPLCDEALLERVLRNAQRMGERARVSRIGESRAALAPPAWPSPPFQSGFAPPRGAI